MGMRLLSNTIRKRAGGVHTQTNAYPTVWISILQMTVATLTPIRTVIETSTLAAIYIGYPYRFRWDMER